MLSVLLLEPELRQLTPDRRSPSDLLLCGKQAAVASLYSFVQYVIISSPQSILYIIGFSDVASMQELIAWHWIRRVGASAAQDARLGSVGEAVD